MEESNSWSERTGKRSEETAEALRKLRAQADESLNTRRRHLSDMETELNHRIQQVAAELAHDLVETRAPAEKAAQEERFAQIAALTAQIEQEAHQQDQLQEELVALQQEKAQIQEQLQAQIDHQQQLQEQLTAQSSTLEDLEQQQGQANEQLQALAGQRDQACQALSELQAQPCGECEPLRQRVAQFEQTECEQTQRLAELENEQARLHGERDALAARISELEAAALAELDAEQQEQIAELKQRFEMAVDDVRQLKQENSELQARTEALQTGRTAPRDDGPLDWQAQKARLLASLAEEEGEPLTEQRQQERTTIMDTVSITDRVVADKDQEIVDLCQQLAVLQADFAAADSQPSASQSGQTPQETVLADDEIIQRERDRLEQLQQEWEEKLRQAELDISIERAALARGQATLEGKLAAVQAGSTEEQQSSDQQRPRRRWLAALGLQGEDEEEA